MKIAARRFSQMISFVAAFSIAVLAVGCAEEVSEDPLAAIREMHKKGQFQGSLAPLRALLDENSDQPEANFLLGKALVNTNEGSLAIWPLRRAIKTPEYAIKGGLLLARSMLKSRTPDDTMNAMNGTCEITIPSTSAT